MAELPALALAVAAIAAVADWIAVARNQVRLEYIAKPLTMVALIAFALAVEPSDESRRAWFVAAGTFSLAGDVFLMLPRDRFVPGLVAFLLAHLCYIGGLVQLPVDPGLLALGVAAVVIAVAVAGAPVLRAVRSGPQAALLGPVVVYLLAIATMVALAIATGPALAAVGALLFFASDTILAWRRFVRPLSWGAVAIMVTYHLGQAALLGSLAQV